MRRPREILIDALLLTAMILLASGCGGTPRRLLVIHTTDVHGYYSMPTDRALPGGLERLGAYVDARRREGPVLLVDSGDMWSGTQLSDRTEGALGVAAYNLLGYDAVALGNHEFDYGPLGTRRQGGQDPFGALRARLAESHFPHLAANLLDRETGLAPTWPGLAQTAVVERGGYKVGLVGVITPDTPKITFPHVGERLVFEEPAEAAAQAVKALRADGADVVFVLAHIGGRCGETVDPQDLSTCEVHGPVFRLARDLARRLEPGAVTAIFGGHTHNRVAHHVAGIPVLQAGHYGRAVSTLALGADPPWPTVSVAPPVSLNQPVGSSDSARKIRALLAPLEAEVGDLRDEELGARLIRPLPRSPLKGGQLGAFFCDVLMEELPDHDLCILNSGGLRKDLPVGALTYGQLYDVLPFGNRPATLEISGRVLLQLLRVSTSGAHGPPQIAGLTLRVDRSLDPCPTEDRDGDGNVGPTDRNRLVDARLSGGEAIDPEATYRVLTNAFLAAGGDAWRPVLQKVHPDRIRVHDHQLPVRDIIAAWMRRRAPVLNSADNLAVPTARLILEGTERGQLCPPP